jgi:hypothetical protein
MAGLSQTAVAARLSVDRKVVNAVRRANFLHLRRTRTPQACPTCGAAVLPKPKVSHEPVKVPRKIKQADAKALFKIADDIIGLATEQIVPNLLFYNIASRCEEVLHSITGEYPHGQEAKVCD